MAERPSLARRLRRWIAGVVATALIGCAVLMALGRLLLPVLLQHPAVVADALASHFRRPVSIAELDGEWRASGPLFRVRDLRIGQGEAAIALPRAELKVDLGAWLSPTRRWLELGLDGVHLKLSRDAAGGWRVAGLGPSHAAGAFDGSLPVDLSLRDLSVDIDDAVSGRKLSLAVRRMRVIGRRGNLRIGAVIGDGSPITLVANIDPPGRNARIYVRGRGIDLATWAARLGVGGWQVVSGKANAQVWLSWRAGKLASASAEVALTKLDLRHADRRLNLATWRGRVALAREGTGWRINARNFAAADDAASVWFGRDGNAVRFTFDAANLDLGAWLPWLQVLPAVPDGLARWLAAAAPHGNLHDAHVAWLDGDHFRVRATLAGVGFAPANGVPGTDAIAGRVLGDGASVALTLPPQPLTVRVPGVFRKSFVYQNVAGTVVLWRAASGWRIGTDGLDFAADNYAGSLRGKATFPRAGGAPILDVAAVVDHAKVAAAKLFWPINVMPPAAVEWLDRGLVAGDVTGRALFRGPLDGFPFGDNSGRFEAVAEFRHLTLDFHPDWPQAEDVRGEVRFVDDGMQANATGGDSLGVIVDKAAATIANFHQPALDLSVSGHGDAGNMLSYLRKSPVGTSFGSAFAELNAKGPARARFKLTMPLHDSTAEAVKLDGHATLAGVDFSVPAWSLALGQLSGPLAFTTTSLAGAGVAGNYGGKPVKLAIRVGSAATDPGHELEATMRGDLDAATLLASYPSLDSLAKLTRGHAPITVGLAIDREPTQATTSAPAPAKLAGVAATGSVTAPAATVADKPPFAPKTATGGAASTAAASIAAAAAPASHHLTIDSDLDGIALLLPAPLAKPATTRLPLHIAIALPFAGGSMRVRLGDVANARLDLAGPTRPLAIDIGLGEAARAPTRGRLQAHGKAATLDLAGWLARAFAGGDSALPPLQSLDIAAANATLGARDLGALHLKLNATGGGFHLDLDGAAIKGSVELPLAELPRRGITARLKRLYWPAGDDDAAAVGNDVAPTALPPLHLWVGDLRLGKARLGEVHFEASPVAGGLAIEQFDARSKEVQISARGRWTGDAASNTTHLAIDLSSHDLGRMLDAFGYPGLIAGGTTLAHIDGSWAGPPSAFSLAAMDGSLKVHVEDGRILEVNPGVGRLFGLFSIRELPRRLSLDFGDIFRSGFAFNSIDGHFAFADGNARTNDLVIRGPSAQIKVSGRTGLKAKDYDQTVVVTPHVGVALPVVGALAGGPVGAAAGLAVQGLIGRGLNRAAAKRYRITGSWDKPDIVLDETTKKSRKPSPRPAPATSAAAKPAKSPTKTAASEKPAS